ncbi:zinc-ribbon domain-containing protein [Alkalihalobacillus sp. BA299]|uniref:zinc-ribbon domain-containing protein n=1 Tax=Alkalihalobacillus sp. BA299 TaxID=2815938 RepID=UPI0027DC924B|nr:zinc-ribbon domain-containing protein [Alkalihalobacillus sp. BA299]
MIKFHITERRVFKISRKDSVTLDKFPSLIKEWHSTKNEELSPSELTSGSGKKVWWQCAKGHEWQALIYSRTSGRGCPYCSGKRVTKSTSLGFKHPNLLKEWNYKKNKDIDPFAVAPKSNKKVWWECKNKHEWKTSIAHRTTDGTKCPYCTNQKVSNSNSLATKFPEIAKEWHSIKNNKSPSKVISGSNKRVWWLCEQGHEWQATIIDRTEKKYGCPYCSGRRVTLENCLATVNPKIAGEWVHKRNGDLTPRDVLPKSGKKVWWQCEQGHEWQATVYNRTYGYGCPYCVGQKASRENNLLIIRPEVAKQWHPTKNDSLTPHDVTPNSKIVVWWICPKGHEWLEAVVKRKNNNCPYCQSIAIQKPQLLKEWHPLKNGDLSPFDFTPGSDKKVWWKCVKGHEWKSSIYNRSKGVGCPLCNAYTQSSFAEKAVFYYLLRVFPDSTSRYIFNINDKDYEVDIYVSSINLAIEYDGYYYHSSHDSYKRDRNKNKALQTQGVKLVRIREEGLLNFNEEHPKVLIRKYDKDDQSLSEVIFELIMYIKKVLNHNILIPEIDVEKDRTLITELMEYGEIKNSFGKVRPDLVKEWNSEKNGKLTPFMFSAGSTKKVWWQCSKGHEWQAGINSRGRQNGTGCPFCAGKKVNLENCLETINPSLAAEWHPIKNKKLTPKDVTLNSGKKVWWLCSKGHEWISSINHRSNGKGCPFCAGQKVSNDNSLSIKMPGLAIEWHSTKNSLTPYDVTCGSGKKVWWQCEQGHEWQATINSRVGGRRCPYCSGRKPTPENCLETVFPNLATEWHPIKNKDITPRDVLPKSGKKVWWQCEQGHEWQAKINNRANLGRGCPYCNNQIKMYKRYN